VDGQKRSRFVPGTCKPDAGQATCVSNDRTPRGRRFDAGCWYLAKPEARDHDAGASHQKQKQQQLRPIFTTDTLFTVGFSLDTSTQTIFKSFLYCNDLRSVRSKGPQRGLRRPRTPQVLRGRFSFAVAAGPVFQDPKNLSRTRLKGPSPPSRKYCWTVTPISIR